MRLLSIFSLLVTLMSGYAAISELASEHNIFKENYFNRTFLVGSVHGEFIRKHEMPIVIEVNKALSGKENNCVFVDVGMNDGFYTHFSSSFGCKVWAFEIQRDCVQFSRKISVANNASHLVNIIHAPVSDKNGDFIPVPMGDEDQQNRCDGAFSLKGQAHKGYTIRGYHRMQSVSLDGFFPNNLSIDVLKVDTEGHEAAVIEGAMNLFKEKRIRQAVVEVDCHVGKPERERVFRAFQNLFSFGYSAACLTKGGTKGKAVGKTVFDFKAFEENFYECCDWNLIPQ